MESRKVLIIAIAIIFCVTICVGAVIYTEVNDSYKSYDFEVFSMDVPKDYKLIDADNSLSSDMQTNIIYNFNNGTDDFNVCINYGKYNFQGDYYIFSLNDPLYFGNEIEHDGSWHYFESNREAKTKYCVCSDENNSELYGMDIFIVSTNLDYLKHAIDTLDVNSAALN